MDDWQQERDEEMYYRQIEHEQWNRDVDARFRESVFSVSLELRQFFALSYLMLREEIEGNKQPDWAIFWQEVNKPNRHHAIFSKDQLITWLQRRKQFSTHTRYIQRRLKNQPVPKEGKARILELLVKSWVNELSCLSLKHFAPWQDVVFYYSVESALEALTYFLNPGSAKSHRQPLSLIKHAPSFWRKSLFSPLGLIHESSKQSSSDGGEYIHWKPVGDQNSHILDEYCSHILNRSQKLVDDQSG